MQPHPNSPHRLYWIAAKLAAVVAVTAFVISCSGLQSTPMSASYNTREGKPGDVEESAKPRRGSAPLARYYLPIPYIQVYAYEVRLLGRETLRIGFRPVVAPDTAHPILIDHNYGSLVEDHLRVTTSPEGLLEYVSLQREPKVVEAAVALGRAALSFAAPVPMPFKGDDGLPEFSRLVFKTNFLVDASGQLVGNTRFLAAGRTFDVRSSTLPLPAGTVANDAETVPAAVYQKSVAGFLHRPLMPLQVSVVEQPDGIDNRSRRREIMRVKGKGTNRAYGDLDLGAYLQRDPAIQIPFAVPRDVSLGADWLLDFSSVRDSNHKVISARPLSAAEIAEVGRIPNAPNANDLVAVEFIEAPITISDVVYIPDQNKVDTFFAPKPWFAAQSFEVRLAGGSVYDVRVRRKSEFLSLVNGISEFAGGIVKVPANLFTFTIVHEQKPASGGSSGDDEGGSKDPSDYRKRLDKDPSDYRRRVDKE